MPLFFQGRTTNHFGAVRSCGPSAPRSIAPSETQGYNHIGRSDSVGSAHSLGSFSFTTGSAFSYNHLERHPSWSSQASNLPQLREEYNRLHPVPLSVSSARGGSYDLLARSPSLRSCCAQSMVTVLNCISNKTLKNGNSGMAS